MALPGTSNHVLDAPSKEISPENFRFLCETIYRDSGIVLDESKGYLIEARLMPIVRSEETQSLDGLCNLIRAASGRIVRQKVVEAMTTNETLFFRDVRPFAALEKTLLHEFTRDKAASGRLLVWSAACSSGQEAYSLAMLWDQLKIPAWNLQILGTDLSDLILEKARAGKFSQLEVNRGLPARYLVKYFTRTGMDWQISSDLMRMVTWEKFNLRNMMTGKGPFDIIMCRNVLIYFDKETKRAILQNLRRVLKPGGCLILGGSETTLGIDDAYQRREVNDTIVYQNPQ